MFLVTMVWLYLKHMQGAVAGVWVVKHQRGYVEGRKTDAREWT